MKKHNSLSEEFAFNKNLLFSNNYNWDLKEKMISTLKDITREEYFEAFEDLFKNKMRVFELHMVSKENKDKNLI